jgi:hypothetical protein
VKQDGSGYETTFSEIVGAIVKHAGDGCEECKGVLLSLKPYLPVITSLLQDASGELF